MRVCGPHDGEIDYSLEQLMKPAMDLLFGTPRYRSLRSVKSSYVSVVLPLYNLLGATARRSTTPWIKTYHRSLHVSSLSWMWVIDELLLI